MFWVFIETVLLSTHNNVLVEKYEVVFWHTLLNNVLQHDITIKIKWFNCIKIVILQKQSFRNRKKVLNITRGLSGP